MLYLAFVHVNKQVRILIKQVQNFTILNTMTHLFFIQFIQVHLLNKWHSLYGIPLVVKV